MAIKRVMGTETEYGIINGDASAVLNNYKGPGKKHENKSETNNSAVAGMVDRFHIGGDYEGQDVDMEVASQMGFAPTRIQPVERVMTAGGVITLAPRTVFTPGQSIIPATGMYSSYFGRDEMLANGARFYIDMGHPEYSTPECSNPLSLVIADKAGERILEAASRKGAIARIFKNNTDGANSYGTHENYLVDRSKAKVFSELASFMTPFFVSRIVFTGAGKIGFREGEKSREIRQVMSEVLEKYGALKDRASSSSFNELYLRVKDGLERVIGGMSEEDFIYQLSQRADFFEKLIGIETTHNRPIINTRDEQLSDESKYMRFHVICGDGNMSEIANYLKFGTMSLALDLFEDGKLKPLELEDAVEAFHAISRDSSLQERVKTKKDEMTALEIQRYFQRAAERAYRGRDAMTDDILERWNHVLAGLETEPMSLATQLDWVIKKHLIDSYIRKSGKSLSNSAVRNIDLQYHEVNREKGLFYVLQNNGLVERVVTDEQIEHAVENPPEDTRAYLRGELIRRNSIQSADWDKITLQGQAKDISLKEPLAGTKEQVGYLFENGDKTPEQIMTELDSKGFVEARTFFQKIFKKGKRKSKSGKRSTKFYGGKNDTRTISSWPDDSEF